MALTKEEEKLNSVLKADYVLWFGKRFKELPMEVQHTLLENLCEWGFGFPPLGSNPSYLTDREDCYKEYTIGIGEALEYNIFKLVD
jgi:hypothetical protein